MSIKIKDVKTYNLQIYTACNHKCRMCLAYDRIKGTYQKNLTDIREKIRYLKKRGYNNINFAGAEPTLYPYLFEAIRYLHKLGLGCTISTNGNLLSSPEYTKKFLSAGPVAFKIPFHSHKAEVFEYITGVRGSFPKVLSGIDNINNYLKVKDLDYSGVTIKDGLFPLSSLRRIFNKNSLQIDIPVNKLNYRDLPDMVSFLHDRQVKVIKFFSLLLSGSLYKHPELVVGSAQVKPFLAKAIARAKKFNIFFFITRFPVCLLESEEQHFVPPRLATDCVKLIACVKCRYESRCYGLTKLSLIAKYRRELLKAKDIFPEDLFARFFTKQDLSFIKKL